MVTIHYRTADIGGLDIFYREAGPVDGPVVLLLHAFPSSSHMFRALIPTLGEAYHVIAPDLPGFGFSAMPPRDSFAYGFGRFAMIVAALLERLGIEEFSLYVTDYGAPVGFRLALQHPKRVRALIVQNGNAYEEGLKDFWASTKALWADNSASNRDALKPFLAIDGTRFQYLEGVADPSTIDPSAVLHDQTLLDRPGNTDIQLDIIYDYRTNVALYPAFQEFFRSFQPPTLIVWGDRDPIFPVEAARAYLRDLPDAELHLLDTGHFALEDKADQIIPLVRHFLDRTVGTG